MIEPLAVNEKVAAAMLGVSLSTVRRRTDLPVVRIGGRRLYHLARLRVWLDAQIVEQGREVA